MAPWDQVQVNGGIHPGNSGGPVVDSRGVVIGVSVAGIRGTTINFAVPGEKVQDVMRGRVAELAVGESYLKDAGTKLPVEIQCLDPMNRLLSVKIDVWTGNHGRAWPASPSKPATVPGDGPPKQRAGLPEQ